MYLTKKLLGNLKNLKVKNQLLGMYIIVVIIPVLILGFFLTRCMCDMVVDRAINEASINIDRIKERMNETIKVANSVADRIYVDDRIRTILTTRYESYGEVVAAYNTVTTIEECLQNYSELTSIRVYTDNVTLLSNSNFMHATDEIKKEEWYQEAILRNDRIEWDYKYDEITKKSHLALIRSIHDKEHGLIGVVVININPERLQSIIKDEPYDTLIAVNQEVIATKGDRELLEGQLGYLRQINPHFLYNTLETIRMKAYCNGQTELARVVKLLSKLMRRNLEVTEREITVQNEVEMITGYLEIQKFRFGNRISYEIKGEEEAMHLSILPLIIQPLVENAFVHGLEGKMGEGKIICTIEVKEGLVITVEDNGLGIEAGRLKALQMQLEDGTEKLEGSFGLYNINQRIKLYYGEQYGIHIISTLEQGTKVIVNLPKVIGG